MQKRIWENYSRFYFVGIGGVSMSALAEFLIGHGVTVAGSDASHSVYTDKLVALGAKICIGNTEESIENFDVIVYTDAIADNNPALIQARNLGKTVLSRGQLLAEISKSFGKVIAVSGCHGKTTATSMLAHVFKAAGLNFCAHIGGRDKTFSNFYYCGNDYFLTEACEFKQNFLLLKPYISVILNTDPDHMECYGTVQNLKNAYVRFACSAETSVALYGDLCAEGITFGLDKNAVYSAEKIAENADGCSFYIREHEKVIGKISLNVFGRHNVLNALAVAATALAAGIEFEYIEKGLAEFSGVERRFENIGKFNGATVIADYAHHPNELQATLKTAKKLTAGKIFTVFQPHTYSRTRNLFKDFVRVLSPLKNLLVYRTFAAREYYDDKGSALTLSQHIKNCRYGDDMQDIVDFLADVNKKDIILVLGAGDIYDCVKELVQKHNG